MQIGLDDLDPQIAAKMEERLAAPLHHYLQDDIFFGMSTRYNIPGFVRGMNERDATEEERRAFEHRLERDNVQGNVARARFLAFFLAAIAGSLVASVTPIIGIMFALFTWLLILQSTSHQIAYRRPANVLRRTVNVEELNAVVPLLKLSSFERTYANTLLWLVNREHYADENSLRATLHDLNKLLTNARQMERQKQQIEEAIQNDSVTNLEAQQHSIAEQLAQAEDSVVRHALSQSLTLCETRLNNARSLETSLKRLDAQREVIQQTFALVQSSLTHSHVSQVQATVPHVTHIQQSVSEMASSVEKSVQEMLTLHGE